jgi:hypothetical protein
LGGRSLRGIFTSYASVFISDADQSVSWKTGIAKIGERDPVRPRGIHNMTKFIGCKAHYATFPSRALRIAPATAAALFVLNSITVAIASDRSGRLPTIAAKALARSAQANYFLLQGPILLSAFLDRA